ncbi:MAG: hypothetical protein M1831_003224 [Alyxoria varia]|nr:MAG: hypothetical protein M1831_003224 [Alyxoria varia]
MSSRTPGNTNFGSSVPTSPLSACSETAAKGSETTPSSSPPSEGIDQDNMVRSQSKDDIMEVDANPSAGVSATMETEELRMQEASRKQDEARDRKLQKERQKDIEGGSDAVDSKFKALDYLLSQSKLYSAIMLQQMNKQEEAETKTDEKAKKRAQKREEEAEEAAQVSQRRSTRNAAGKDGEADGKGGPVDNNKAESSAGKGKGRGRAAQNSKKPEQGKMTDFLKKRDLEDKAGKGASIQEALEEEANAADDEGVKPTDIGVQNLKSARQPDLLSGGVMRGYQLEGLEWLTSLYENGLNGILADEMGLGKTIQTIAFLAFLREKGIYGPFLIAAPLSTTSNWVDEFQQWAPDIPVVLYHGSKQEREEIRRKRLRNPGNPNFPVVCTSYEISMNDRKFLSHFGWKFIIVDEGHRIKNLNCRLIRELQSYQSANRLLITGTPLQNNLAELWSLLHFLMPDIFDKLESFESWFDFSALKEKNGHEQILSEERKSNLVTSLHAILKPFLLRRIKADVEHTLPKKREYVLFAPMTTEQKELYQEILGGNSRAYLENKAVESIMGSREGSGVTTPQSAKSTATGSSKKRKAPATGQATPNKSTKTSRDATPATSDANGSARDRRSKKTNQYAEISDREFFKKLEDNPADLGSEIGTTYEEKEEPKEVASTLELAKRQIAQKKLQNPLMQLRLCCNSPHNFYDPWLYAELASEEQGEDNPNLDYSGLVTASGKMQLLDRLLRGLLDAPADHKVLIFSQFKSSLDLLARYLDHILNIPPCRIDGSVHASDRSEQIRLFNAPESKRRVFLLSTRAGGQGINLAAADTVILFDSDWNPQQDLQAQDRAHRIGQRRNVVVYRLATRGTVEEMLLGKAEGKRRLEKLVIKKGKFKSWNDEASGAVEDEDVSNSGKKGSRKSNSARQSTNGQGDEDEDTSSAMNDLKRALAEADGTSIDTDKSRKSTGRKRNGGTTGAYDPDELLTDEDLRVLIDRSEAAYERAEEDANNPDAQEAGEAGPSKFQAVQTKKDGEGGLLEGLSG